MSERPESVDTHQFEARQIVQAQRRELGGDP
jgi:hypothetical protein